MQVERPRRCDLVGHVTRSLSDRLAVDGELSAAVLLPAGFVLLGAELLLLAVADDADAVGGDAGVDQRGLGGVGAVLAEGEVVLGRAAVVAVAADDDLDGGMRVEVGGGLVTEAWASGRRS